MEGGGWDFTLAGIIIAVGAAICLISFTVDHQHRMLGKIFKRKNIKHLSRVLLKSKEALVILECISLLLVILQGILERICIPQVWANIFLPCKRQEFETFNETVVHVELRKLLTEAGIALKTSQCARKGKVPLLSAEALHHLEIFNLILALSHVIFSIISMLLGGAVTRKWKHLEDTIRKYDTESGKVAQVDRFKPTGRASFTLSWLHSFGKQFYGAVSKSDYTMMRLGFIAVHCNGNHRFNYHKYMVKAVEADLKRIGEISWYLWVFVIVFLLLNVNGWHAYLWITFVPLVLLLVVGIKLEHVLTQLVDDVAEKNSTTQGDAAAKLSDEHFWFKCPKLILYLMQFILFQNAFEHAFFFWLLITDDFDSCIMARVGFIFPRLFIRVITQLICCYIILPLYTITTQLGSSFNKAMFDEHVSAG